MYYQWEPISLSFSSTLEAESNRGSHLEWSLHQIKALLEAGHSQTKIAEIIGVHKSTISRELTRNVPTRGRYANAYRPESAQRKTNQRHRDKRKHRRFTEDLKEDASRWLEEEKLSPELISGRWAVRGIDGVSHEAIYQWIWRGKRQNDPATKKLYTHLVVLNIITDCDL